MANFLVKKFYIGFLFQMYNYGLIEETGINTAVSNFTQKKFKEFLHSISMKETLEVNNNSTNRQKGVELIKRMWDDHRKNKTQFAKILGEHLSVLSNITARDYDRRTDKQIGEDLKNWKEKVAQYFETNQSGIVFPLVPIISGSKMFYILYYWTGLSIRKAKVTIELDNKEWLEMNIEYKAAEERNEEKAHAIILRDDIYTTSKTLFFVTDDSKNKTVFAFLTDSKPIEDRRMVFGCYTKSSAHSGRPAAGVCFLHQQKNNEDAELKSNEIDTAPYIFNKLYSRRDDLTNEQTTYSDFNVNFPNYNEIHELDEFAGTYIGFHLDNNYEKGCFRTLLMLIESSGKAILKDDKGKHKGFFSKTKEGLLYGTFDWVDEEQIYRLHMWIEADLKSGRFLHGLYGGWGSDRNKQPMGGLIKFEKKVIDPAFISAKSKGKTFSSSGIQFPHSYSIKEQTKNFDIQTFFKENIDIIKFFKADIETYINKPSHALADVVLKFLKDSKSVGEKYEGLNGNFYLYSLSSERNRIIKIPTRISKDGFVIIKKNSFKEDSKRIDSDFEFKGYAKYLDRSYLSFVIDELNEREYFGHYLFKIPNISNDEFRFAFGVSSRPNRDHHVQAKREFLAACKDDFKEMVFKEIMLDSGEYEELNKIYSGLADSLTGREYNLIVNSSSNKKLTNRTDFITMFLVSAIYQFQKSDYQQFTFYLIMAFEHGLFPSLLNAKFNETISEFQRSKNGLKSKSVNVSQNELLILLQCLSFYYCKEMKLEVYATQSIVLLRESKLPINKLMETIKRLLESNYVKFETSSKFYQNSKKLLPEILALLKGV